MPKQATTDDVDTLQAEAEQLAGRTGEVRARLERLETERLRREQAGQQRFDRELVASYSRAALDAEVEQARRTLDAALADNPLVLALADYLAALLRRYHAVSEHLAARSRLGHDVSGAAYPPAPELGPVEDVLHRAVQHVANDRVGAELHDLHTARQNAGTTEEKR